MSNEITNLIKTHGLSVVLMLGGLYFLNNKLSLAEERISALEERLYDCYEKRSITSNSPLKESKSFIHSLEFVIPENKKQKGYDYSII